MRLLYSSPFYWPSIGGMEVISAKLVGALRARGHEVRVVTSHGQFELPDEEERDGVRIHRFPFHRALETSDPVLLLRTQRRLAQLKREFRPDVVHVNLTDASVIFHLLTAAAYPSKVVVALHMMAPEQLCGPETVFGRVLRAADWVTAVSEAPLAAMRRVMPEIAPISSVILNGIEAPRLRPRPLPTEPPMLLCVGRMSAEKGFDTAIAGFASIAGRWPTMRLVIAGDGAERLALEQQAQLLGVAGRVDFLGWVAPDGVPALINDATIVLMPSRSEGLPLVAIEAALMARPLVATRVGGLPEVVLDGETGVLVECDNSEALGGAVASLLEHPQRAAQMGHAARARALNVFSGERCVAQYDLLYQHLTREPVYADAR